MAGRHAFGEQTVDDLVYRAITAEGQNNVDVVSTCLPSQIGGVQAMCGVYDVDVNCGGQRPDDDLTSARRCRRRIRINNQDRSHTRSLRRSIHRGAATYVDDGEMAI